MGGKRLRTSGDADADGIAIVVELPPRRSVAPPLTPRRASRGICAPCAKPIARRRSDDAADRETLRVVRGPDWDTTVYS